MSIGITKLVESGINLAFSLTPDIHQSGVYKRRKGSVYNTETGVVEPNETTANVTYIVTPYSEEDVGDNIKAGDEKVVIRFKLLMAAGITTISGEDILVQNDGITREIVGHRIDPTKQVLTLHTRAIAVEEQP